MKKFTLLTAVAAVGLLGLSARAATISDVDLVKVQLTALVQTNPIDTSSGEKFRTVKLKIVTKDVLSAISNQFHTTFPAGAQLSINHFPIFDESTTIDVLDKTGAVLLANAGVTTNDDDYELFLSTDNVVFSGKETSSKDTFQTTVVSELVYDNATDSKSLDVNGSGTLKQTFSEAKETESFKLTGAGDAFVNDNEAVVTGTVTGSGKDNSDIDFPPDF